jgi:hypothetical protein
MISNYLKVFVFTGVTIFFTACFKQDNTAPTISLRGSSELFLPIGTSYVEPGFEAEDDKDGDIERLVKVTGLPNMQRAAKYIIQYNVTDASGNKAVTQERIVNVYHVNTYVVGTYNTTSQCITGTNNFTLVKVDNTSPYLISIEMPSSSKFTEFKAEMIGPTKQAININFTKGDSLYIGDGFINGLGNEMSLRIYKSYQGNLTDSCLVGLFKTN